VQIKTTRFTVQKRYPLTISRGTSTGTENLLVEVAAEGVTGRGEMSPAIASGETAEIAEADVSRWAAALSDGSPWEMQRIEDVLDEAGGGNAARAALDIALHDWRGQRLGQPLWKLWGLERSRIVPTSLTLGISSPEQVRERIPEILARTGAKILKIKLGSPDGPEADQAMFAVCQEAAPPSIAWRVDANGGWDVPAARAMLLWLAERGVEFVEQPLERGREAELPALYRDSPLPLYADESVRVAADVPPLADRVHGVNLKLMKCGGLAEAWRIVHTARACGLRVMFGCMSESTLAITAAAHLSPLADALDLDSHLNLVDDPFTGAGLREGRVVPNDLPGLGVRKRVMG
jgi:L-alanine-DL-glutamate epimerase-like enolase superfamily enzyme